MYNLPKIKRKTPSGMYVDEKRDPAMVFPQKGQTEISETAGGSVSNGDLKPVGSFEHVPEPAQ